MYVVLVDVVFVIDVLVVIASVLGVREMESGMGSNVCVHRWGGMA